MGLALSVKPLAFILFVQFKSVEKTFRQHPQSEYKICHCDNLRAVDFVVLMTGELLLEEFIEYQQVLSRCGTLICSCWYSFVKERLCPTIIPEVQERISQCDNLRENCSCNAYNV